MRKASVVLLVIVLLAVSLPAFSTTIGEAKTAADGTTVVVSGKVMYLELDECYIEALDRSTAIRVNGDMQEFQAGNWLSVTGTVAGDNGERVINGTSIYKLTGDPEITPYFMNNKAVAGAVSAPGLSLMDYGMNWILAGGANNIGTLIKTSGKITAVYDDASALGGRWFYIDDGCGVAGDFGDSGVLVYSDAFVKEGQYVSVTGISSVEPALDMTDKLMRVILTRNADDVVVLKDVETKQYPFSDEFNTSTLDKRWSKVRALGSISLTDTPGCLTYYAVAQGASYDPLQLIQPLSGDWDLEFKVKPDFSSDTAIIFQGFGVLINAAPNYPIYYNNRYIGLAGAFKSGNNNSYICLLNTILDSICGDWYYFRIRSRNGTFYGSVSTDGVNYSQEYSCAGASSGFISLYGLTSYSGTTKPAVNFHAHFDYFRLTSAVQ